MKPADKGIPVTSQKPRVSGRDQVDLALDNKASCPASKCSPEVMEKFLRMHLFLLETAGWRPEFLL